MECGEKVKVQITPPPQQVKQKRKGGWLLPYRVIASLLVVALSVNAFINFRKIDPDNRNSKNDGITPNGDEVIYNSKAFEITPMDGLTVSANENALDKNRTVTAKEVPFEDTPEVVMELLDAYTFTMKIIELDAGMEEGEELPGTLDCVVDLDVMEIDAKYRDNLVVHHRSASGEYTQLQTTVKGSKLYFSTKRNELLTIGVMVAVPVLIYTVYETAKLYIELNDKWNGFPRKKKAEVSGENYREEWWYMGTSADATKTVETCTNIASIDVNGKYRLHWVVADGSEYQKTILEWAEVWKKVNEDAVKEYPWYGTLGTAKLAQERFDYIWSVLSNISGDYGKRYAAVADKLNNKEWVVKQMPGDVKMVYDALVDASNYIHATLELKSRPEILDVIAAPDSVDSGGNEAVYRTPDSLNPYVLVYLKQIQSFVLKETRNQVYIMVAHEMFHAVQSAYGSVNPVFNEAVALFFEDGITTKYKDEGKIEKTYVNSQPPEENSRKWEYLAYSMDKGTGDYAKDGHYGYTLSRLLKYMRDDMKIEKINNIAEVMETYESKKSFSETMVALITREKFNEAYKEFVSANYAAIQKTMSKGMSFDDAFTLTTLYPTGLDIQISNQNYSVQFRRLILDEPGFGPYKFAFSGNWKGEKAGCVMLPDKGKIYTDDFELETTDTHLDIITIVYNASQYSYDKVMRISQEAEKKATTAEPATDAPKEESTTYTLFFKGDLTHKYHSDDGEGYTWSQSDTFATSMPVYINCYPDRPGISSFQFDYQIIDFSNGSSISWEYEDATFERKFTGSISLDEKSFSGTYTSIERQRGVSYVTNEPFVNTYTNTYTFTFYLDSKSTESSGGN